MCSLKVARVFLIVINIIFFVVGIGILIPGILFLAEVDLVTDEIKPVAESVEFAGVTLESLLSDLAIAFVCLGAFVLIVSGFGLIGACCGQKICLILYVILVIALVIFQLTTVILYIIMADNINSELKTSLTKSMQTHFKYDALDSTDSITNAFNYLFLTYKCCSFNDITSTTNDFDTSPWCTDSTYNGRCYLGNGEIPRSCCNGVTKDTYSSQPSSCTVSLVNYYNQGCVDKIKSDIVNLGYGALAVGVIGLVVQVLAVIAGLYMCCKANKEVDVV